MPLPSGLELDHYRILSPLGAGGMGEVYLAEDLSLGRQVAIKVLPEHLTRDPDRVRRFEREARAVSALNHSNIVTIYELGQWKAGRFIAMELVRGRTLREVIARTPTESVAPIGRQLAEALRAAHDAGITHRDLKPENVMLRDDGYAKVLDFGLAVLAPAASDIFALGIVLYELATTRHPFAGPGAVHTLHAILADAPIAPSAINPEVPAGLNAVILRMLQKAPRDRPAAAAVEQTLAETSRSAPSSAGARTVARSVRQTVGREAERRELVAAFDAVEAGFGLLLTIAGEPGSGKTTLVEDFLSELGRTRACGIARGRCSERLAGTDAYMPWLDALGNLLHSSSDGSPSRAMRALAPDWYVRVAGAADSSAVALRAERPAMSKEALTQELVALLQELTRERPLVFFFDDLHWADVSTIELLTFVADRFDQIRLLVIVTVRPSELFLANHAFLKVKPGLQARELRTAMSLGRLWRRQGRGDEAKAVVERVHASFTEGHDSIDLRDARQWLAAPEA